MYLLSSGHRPVGARRVAVQLIGPRCALEVVPHDLRLPCRSRWLVLVVVGVGCLGLGLAQRRLAAEAHFLHVIKDLARPCRSTQRPGDLSQHPDVLLGGAEVAEPLGARCARRTCPCRPSGRRLPPPAVWDQGPAKPRRDDAHERIVVCRRASTPRPLKFFMLLPKALTNLSGAEALDLSGWLMKDLRQVSGVLSLRVALALVSL